MEEQKEYLLWKSIVPLARDQHWSREVFWTNVLSDIILAIAYFSIPIAVLYFFWFRRNDYSFRSIYVLFAFFLTASGAVYLIDVLVLWNPNYELQAAIKFVAAVASLSAVIFLWPILPKFLKIPTDQLIDKKNKELEFASDKYNLLLAGTRVGVYEWSDLKNWQQPIFWSPRMFEMLKLAPGEFSPTIDQFISLVHPEDREIIKNLLRDVHSDRVPVPIECRIRVAHGFRWFRIRHVVNSEKSHGELFIVGSVEDIHEQKVADEKLRAMNVVLEDEVEKRTRQLEQANRAKTRFLANMSHEMRTPLGLVLGFSEILESNKSLDSEAQEYVQLIQKNGEILSRVINDLLDLSKIEAGKLKFQYSKVLISNLIEDFESAFTERADKKGLKIVFDNLCDSNQAVVTDEIRIKQVVYNLLSNALKFTDRGAVHLKIGKLQGQTFYIDVLDTGIGIPDSEKDQIFEEFSRGELVEAGHRAGTGLGLRLAQNLAQGLGGRIDLMSSQVGKGSHFRFLFTSEENRLQNQDSRRKEISLKNQLSELSVFVLDDSEDNVRLAEVFLKKMGCSVRGFVSPKSLFAEMNSSTPELILLDINMPEMSGFEVFDRLRSLGYSKPIWALTAYSLNEDIQTILDHGFDDFIRKPISLDSMKKKLAYELRERSHD